MKSLRDDLHSPDALSQLFIAFCQKELLLISWCLLRQAQHDEVLINCTAFFTLMFIGEYQTQLGEKNRLAMPKKLRADSNSLIATRGYENCVLIVDLMRWDSLIKEINQKPLLNLSLRDTKRFLIGGAHELELDAQGRFVLPDSLKQYAHIDKEVVFLGVGEWIELWDLEAWKNKLDYLSKNSADIADRL